MSKDSCQRCGHSEHGATYHACAMCGNVSGSDCFPATGSDGYRAAYDGAQRLNRVRNGVPKALLMGEGDEGSTVEWGTPDHIFDKWDAIYKFTMDPATRFDFHASKVILSRGGRIITLNGVYEDAPVYNGGLVVGAEPWLIEDADGAPLPGDGLDPANLWTGNVWMNHPYGRADWRWVKKAHDSVRFGSADVVVALLPSKTQMRWWHKYVLSRRSVVRSVRYGYRRVGEIMAQTVEYVMDRYNAIQDALNKRAADGWSLVTAFRRRVDPGVDELACIWVRPWTGAAKK